MSDLHGTFQLNKEEQIHSWYPYLAGFSAEFVREKIKEFNLDENSKIFDPFAGVGTTLLVAKMGGIFSEGVEINPFASFVSDTKLYLEHDIKELQERKENILELIGKEDYNLTEIGDMPALLKRAFSPIILKKLRMIRNVIYLEKKQQIKNLFLLALISILKEVSNYKNFSPYLEPRKEKIEDAEVIKLFSNKLNVMVEDASDINNETHSKVYTLDARDLSFLESKFDLIVTSPPYLNNWDYSWITKIELLFMEIAEDRQELNETIRNKLVTSSTYLLNKNSGKGSILPSSNVKTEIEKLVLKLKETRTKRSKNAKKYDLMVCDYFNDIYLILKELSGVMNKGANSLWVVGDSALYGVHIPTDELIGKISELVGFRCNGCKILRDRRATRHDIKLRESVVAMEKK
jgi:hypothetical protein